ncbi:uncharacterized protein BT62DRAFT_211884 [Guyanagaster necrorhizus]|uniref:DUF6535 domain-containing protein n=1 Tax=Guyanagaster necrorhizus TaxID=856835 RepID=A0A9P7VSE5_9AGAR|nr:uncharacterized protein BT62DRAFT_211884 [Guyanagaster necrorhizus MCA 3950]KAG7445139.1 hypothetical protein BT62DRAFT_211884 [Guyanagaster necrorhizus MCA 3950]
MVLVCLTAEHMNAQERQRIIATVWRIQPHTRQPTVTWLGGALLLVRPQVHRHQWLLYLRQAVSPSAGLFLETGDATSQFTSTTAQGPRLRAGTDVKLTLWDFYDHEARASDKDVLKHWHDDMRTLLIVACLLSAVQIAFIIEFYVGLKPVRLHEPSTPSALPRSDDLVEQADVRYDFALFWHRAYRDRVSSDVESDTFDSACSVWRAEAWRDRV